MKRCATPEEGPPSKKARTVASDAALKEVRPSSVPLYLRSSEFYKSLNTEDDEMFHIPAYLMKENTIVETLSEACDLMHTIRYWGSDASLLPVIQFALQHTSREIKSKIRAFEKELPLMSSVLFVLNSEVTVEDRMEKAMELGIEEVVRFVHDQDAAYTQKAIAGAAERGHFDCLLLALQAQNRWQVVNMDGLYEGAIAKGQLACLKLLDSSEYSFSKRQDNTPQPDPAQPTWWQRLPKIAAQHGQLECLQFLYQKGCNIDYCAASAAGCGSLACLRYVMMKRTPLQVRRNDSEACIAAAAHGHLNCLKYLREQGNTLEPDVCIEAAACGSVDCVQYYHEQGGTWHFLAIHAAALNGHLQCLQYAHRHGCPFTGADVTPYVVKWYNARFNVTSAPHLLLVEVVRRQHWECVKYLITYDFLITPYTITLLARHGQDALVRLCIEFGAEVSEMLAVLYAAFGKLEYLQLAMEHGCPRSARITSAAAGKGHLTCVMYAHTHGCPWSAEVCVNAAAGGHLQCLKYAYEHGCPLEKEKVVRAAAIHVHILEYIEGLEL